MDLIGKDRKFIGNFGERVAAEYLRRHGFSIEGRNVAKKTGEIDVVARKGKCLHFVEVKSVLCREFPDPASPHDAYDPSANLHTYKIRKVARTAEWYVAEQGWEGEWQVDGILVWLRERDALARVQDLPQILESMLRCTERGVVRGRLLRELKAESGRRIPVVRLLWEQDDGVRFSAPRLSF